MTKFYNFVCHKGFNLISMFKYLRIAAFYPAAIQYYYDHFPTIVNEPYAKQYRHFMDECFGFSDFYETELNLLGAKAIVIPLNVKPIQEAWAKENGIEYDSAMQLIEQQIQQFQPDVISIRDNNLFDAQWLTTIREKIPSIRLIIGNCCSPYTKFTLSQYQKCDFVLCCCHQLSEQLRQYNLRTHVIMHGFEETILTKTTEKPKKIKVLFTGSILPAKGLHTQRNELINYLLTQDIELTIYGFTQRQYRLAILLKQFIYKSFFYISKLDKHKRLNNTWLYKRILAKSYPQYHHLSRKLKQSIRPPKFGLDMFQLLRETDICLNIHGDIASEDAANMRLFEATGMGTCLVTDWKANMCTLFDDGAEVLTYKDPQDCAEKIKWLLKHPEKIQQIAEAGQKRCLSEHTVHHRTKQLFDIITRELKNKK